MTWTDMNYKKVEYVDKDAVLSLLEDKQRELCPTGRYGRGYVGGSDREEYDRWQEMIDAIFGFDSVYVYKPVETVPPPASEVNKLL